MLKFVSVAVAVSFLALCADINPLSWWCCNFWSPWQVILFTHHTPQYSSDWYICSPGRFQCSKLLFCSRIECMHVRICAFSETIRWKEFKDRYTRRYRNCVFIMLGFDLLTDSVPPPLLMLFVMTKPWAVKL